MVVDNRRRLQVDISPEQLKQLRQYAFDMSDSEDGRIGAGTIASRLLESLAAHPELIQKLLTEYANTHDAASAAQSAPFPKAATGRRR